MAEVELLYTDLCYFCGWEILQWKMYVRNNFLLLLIHCADRPLV